ncbi:MAG TPA: UvrB/UvrC motif-containing protein [Candidatus Omnitrophota bacterium]|nr:UvrB/UvrC motif-containing protein [Candidatus Omnitrophota bacterium]HNX82520.1 UvrB/UvrC motif-containing protein [Candidatus Omnitrophota bacterium]HPT07362.1 UvrB/UvrC motif-containing protein [Candidatus Omnitrophota bacterium]
MICDSCGKKPATVHLTEIVDDQMTELHLCEDCARAKSSQMEQQFGLSDLLGGLAEFHPKSTASSAGTPAEATPSLKCPRCGASFEDFKKVGRLGCSECYEVFKKYLGPLLKRIHGSNIHFGKSPMKTAKTPSKKKVDVQELRLQLQKAIEIEAFEEAARLRDQIKQLEQRPEDKPDEGGVHAGQ